MFRLSASSLANADSGRTVWKVEVPFGVSFEDLLVPTCWEHVANRFQPNESHRLGGIHKIEVYPEDGSYYAELIVRYAERTEILVGVIMHVPFEQIEVDTGDGAFEVDHKGFGRWRVVRRDTRALAADGFKSKASAYDWIAKNSRVMATSTASSAA